MVSSDILASLTAIANEWRALASAWHVVIAAAGVTMWWRRVDARAIAALLSLMAFSVAAMAAWSGNPFNIAVFVALGLVMVALAAIVLPPQLGSTHGADLAAGAVMCAFGWLYPHFLSGSAWQYLYAAPLGLLPCPTLAFIIGVSLLTNSFDSTAWAILCASLGLFYGVTGVFVFGVAIDWLLVGGATILAATALRRVRIARTKPFTDRRTI